MAKSPIPKALRAIASALEDLESHEIDMLISGSGHLIFVHGDKAAAKPETISFNIQSLLDRLEKCESRDSAQHLLSEVEAKDRLVSIAKALKVHIVKNDRREDIEGKIIAFAIGRKLRSEAIQSSRHRYLLAYLKTE